MRGAYAMPCGQSLVCHPRICGADRQDFGDGELGYATFFAARICPVTKPILAEGMAGVAPVRRRAMGKFAHHAGSRALADVRFDAPIALAGLTERPKQASVSSIILMIGQPRHRRARRDPASLRIAMPLPSLVVGRAKASGTNFLGAPFNRTYSLHYHPMYFSGSRLRTLENSLLAFCQSAMEKLLRDMP